MSRTHEAARAIGAQRLKELAGEMANKKRSHVQALDLLSQKLFGFRNWRSLEACLAAPADKGPAAETASDTAAVPAGVRTAASETQPAPSPHAPNNPLLRWQTPTDKESLAATQALEKIIGDAVSHARRNGATPAGLRMLVLDWSGSLTCDEHLTAAVAYILTARECGLPCGASVFADRALTMNPTDDYDALLDWLFDTTMKQRAGGGNSIPGLAGLENNCAPGTCVMYLTDFNFYTRDQKADIAALKALTEFRKVTLETIVLGTEWAPGDELGLLPAPSNICLTLEELIRNSIRICLHPGSR